LLFWGVVRIIIEGVIIGAFVMFAANPIVEKLLIFCKKGSQHPSNKHFEVANYGENQPNVFFKNEIEFY
jgi:hypothetical protein